MSGFVRDLITSIFPHAQVLQAQNGREGITLASMENPDVILLDTHMPVMDGYETAQVLQAHPETRAILIIAMTLAGSERSQSLENLRPLSRPILLKPFEGPQLAAVIRETGSDA